MTLGALILSLGGIGKLCVRYHYVVAYMICFYSHVPELSNWSISLQKTTRYSDSEDDEHKLNEILSKRAARTQQSNAVPTSHGGSVPTPSREENARTAEIPNSGDTLSRASILTPSVESVDLASLTNDTGAANEDQMRTNGGNNRGTAKKRGKSIGGRGRGKGARGRGGKVTQ